MEENSLMIPKGRIELCQGHICRDEGLGAQEDYIISLKSVSYSHDPKTSQKPSCFKVSVV